MEKKIINSGFGILVLDRGNVLVGKYSYIDGDKFIEVTDGQVIRRWGTTMGLGELAKGGPTNDTKLDPLNGVTHATFHSLIMIIEADPGDWQ